MIRCIDAMEHVDALFDHGTLNMEKWEAYIHALYPDAVKLLKEDVQSYLDVGEYTFEKDFLPLISAVRQHPALPEMRAHFARAVDGLNVKLQERLQCTLDADIVLYLGLCNAAGWVTQLGGRRVVLLGAEKILELGWYSQDTMYGLIYHELGHIFHDQYGTLHTESTDSSRFVWQLFTEGVAMHIEQVLVGEKGYFHQDQNGWKHWCKTHLDEIARDFARDLPSMTRENQRYFGDWADYRGHGDVGYYLGTDFVQYCLEQYDLLRLVRLNAEMVCGMWQDYLTQFPCPSQG